MDHFLNVAVLLGLGLIIAKVVAGAAERLGIPAVVSELSIGLAIGVSGYGLDGNLVVQAFSELGVLLLLFVVGLETDLHGFMRVGRDAAWVAMVGVGVPFVLAFGLLLLPLFGGGFSFSQVLFLAAALTATSVGVTARVLHDLKVLSSVSGRIILGAAVIDDVLGLLVLTVVAALASHGTISFLALGLIFLKVVLFFTVLLLLRRFFLAALVQWLRHIEAQGTLVVFLFGGCLVVAWIAQAMGLAGVVGAFAFGLILEDVHFREFHAKKDRTLAQLLQPWVDVLAPLFFLVMGMGVRLQSFSDPGFFGLVLILVVCAVVGKVFAGLPISSAARKEGADRLLIGFGMIPRGEVGLIFAASGLQLGVLDRSLYGAIVIMVLVTTLAAPFLLSWRVRRSA